MVQSEPEGEPQVVSYDFRYELAKEFIEAALDSQGVEVPRFWTISFQLLDLPNRDLRRRARTVAELYWNTPGYPVLDRPTDDPAEFVEASERWIRSAEEKQAEPNSGERAEAHGAEEFANEMDTWVRQFGSGRLRRALDRGYKVNRLYAQERVRREYPKFWLDTSGDAKWRERTDPTERALDLEDAAREEVASRGGQMETRIIWLSYPPPELASRWDMPELEWQAQEAIILQPYLGRYRLFLPVEPDLWKSEDEIGPVDNGE